MTDQINSIEIYSSFWDSTPIGRSIEIYLYKSDQLSPQLILENKIIRLLNNCIDHSQIQFIGTLISDDQSQCLTYVIDRLIGINDIQHHQLLTGEFFIPIQYEKTNFRENGIKQIDSYCHSSLPIELHRFLYICGYISSSVHIDLSFDLLTIKTSFILTPINGDYIQIIPTALLKTFNSPIENNIYMSQPHFGYCSLDRISKNKILLLLENDPKTSTLPLIGIWISGINDIQCSFVWSVCIRYCLNSLLKQRLRSGINRQQSFLLVYYSSISHNQSYFYEVYSKSIMNIEYDVWTCSKQISKTNFSSYPYDFQFKRLYNQSKTSPSKEIPLNDHQQTILSSPNTNGSLFGIPRLPPKQSPYQSPSWDLITTPTTSTTPKSTKKQSTIVSNDTQWKEEFIERMQSYEKHIQSLTELVNQLLITQQNSISTPIRECSKRDIAVQSEPSSPSINENLLSINKNNQYSPQITTTSSAISTDLNPIDILKPIFQFIDKQQQQQQQGSISSLMTTNNSTDTRLLKINQEENDDYEKDDMSHLTNITQPPQQQHVTSTRTTGISLISNGVQMQFINQESSITTVYPQSQSIPSTEFLLTSPEKSENNLSIEVHGLEMKYLEDDQLAVAIECDRQSQTTPQILDKSLSFETQEYLRRYDLFNNPNSE